jgi:AcrR family transcriptional regulator
MSHRQSTSPDPLLDAARASVMAVGVRRTTMSDVARRAQVSRQTAYRRHPDVGSLLSSLMTREFGRVIEAAATHAAELGSGRARVVEQTVRGAELLATEPLFRRILDVDPELLLPYVVERLGDVQRMVIAGLEEVVERGVADGSIRLERPRILAAAVELIARGFVLAAHAEREDPFDPWAELRIALDGYLRPPAS